MTESAQASRQLWHRQRRRRAVQGELPVSHSVTGTEVDSSDIEKDAPDGTSDESCCKAGATDSRRGGTPAVTLSSKSTTVADMYI